MVPRRGMVIALAALLGWGASCGSSVVPAPPATDPGVTAGSRLRPVMAVGDGVEAFLHWHDSELGFDCSFQRDEAGSFRCLPRSFVVFADASCTEPLVLSRCGASATFGVLHNTSGITPDICDPDHDPGAGRYRTYRTKGGPIAAAAYHRGTVGQNGELSCQAEATPLQDGEVLAPAEPIALTSFVEATIVIEDGEERLGRRLMVATDGAAEVWSPFDRTLALPCYLIGFTEGAERRCVPRLAPRVGDFFADPGCSVPAVASECGHHSILVESMGFCEPRRLYGPGDEVAGAFHQSGDSCAATAWEGTFFTVGAPLSPEALPAGILAREGPGRLKTNIHTDAAGRPVSLAQQRLFDAELDEPCEPVDFGDAGTRCLPTARRVPADGAWFADPACSEPVGRELVATCGANPQSRFWWLDPTTCAPHAFDLRESVGLVSAVYALEGDDCVAATIPDGQVAVALGPPLSIDAFPLVDRVVR